MSKKFHEHHNNRHINYAILVPAAMEFVTSLQDIDMTIVKQDAEEVTIGIDITLRKNGQHGYNVTGEIEDVSFIRVSYYNDELYGINVYSRASSIPIFQVFIGQKKIQINETWYDRSTFREVAFMNDVQMALPFELGTIAEGLEKVGVWGEK